MKRGGLGSQWASKHWWTHGAWMAVVPAKNVGSSMPTNPATPSGARWVSLVFVRTRRHVVAVDLARLGLRATRRVRASSIPN